MNYLAAVSSAIGAGLGAVALRNRLTSIKESNALTEIIDIDHDNANEIFQGLKSGLKATKPVISNDELLGLGKKTATTAFNADPTHLVQTTSNTPVVSNLNKPFQIPQGQNFRLPTEQPDITSSHSTPNMTQYLAQQGKHAITPQTPIPNPAASPTTTPNLVASHTPQQSVQQPTSVTSKIGQGINAASQKANQLYHKLPDVVTTPPTIHGTQIDPLSGIGIKGVGLGPVGNYVVNTAQNAYHGVTDLAKSAKGAVSTAANDLHQITGTNKNPYIKPASLIGAGLIAGRYIVPKQRQPY